MGVKRVALMLSIVLCAAGAAMGQTVWDPYPGNPVLGPGDPGEWDDGGRAVEAVVLVGDTYHMYYIGWSSEPQGDHGRGHATSQNGVDWTPDPNPVLPHGSPGEWDACFWGPGTTVVHDGAQFVMWYTAGATCTDGSTIRGGRATSADGSVWEKDDLNNPVLVVGPPGAWDDYYVSPGRVVLDGGVFKLWYNGHNGSFDQIGYAESLDGITWEKYPGNPVLRTGPPGPWDAWVFSPSVVLEGSVYHIWYAGNDRSGGDWMIGYAYSSDGIHWWRSPDNPVISEPGIDIASLPVVFDGLTWHGWYNENRTGERTMYFTSTCCAGIFGDGFESGDTSAWSATVP